MQACYKIQAIFHDCHTIIGAKCEIFFARLNIQCTCLYFFMLLIGGWKIQGCCQKYKEEDESIMSVE